MKAPRDFDRVAWSVTYTLNDGKTWHSELFEHIEEARAFLSAAIAENEAIDGFMYFVEKKVLVNPADLLDDSVRESRVRLLVGRHLVSVEPIDGDC